MKVGAKEPAAERTYTTYQKSSATAGERSVPTTGAQGRACGRSDCRPDCRVCLVAALKAYLADTLSIESPLGWPQEAGRLTNQLVFGCPLKEATRAVPSLHRDASAPPEIHYGLPVSGLCLHTRP